MNAIEANEADWKATNVTDAAMIKTATRLTIDKGTASADWPLMESKRRPAQQSGPTASILHFQTPPFASVVVDPLTKQRTVRGAVLPSCTELFAIAKRQTSNELVIESDFLCTMKITSASVHNTQCPR